MFKYFLPFYKMSFYSVVVFFDVQKLIFIFLRFYLFFKRDEGQEKERKRNIEVQEKH